MWAVLRGHLVAAAACCCAVVSQADGPAPQQSGPDDEATVKRAIELVGGHWIGVAPGSIADPALDAAVQQALLAHDGRRLELARRWLAEDRQSAPAEEPRRATRLFARIENEYARWGVDEDGDLLTGELLQRPGLCRWHQALSVLAFRAALIAERPASERATAWAAEAERLARWGTARSEPPAWPLPLTQDLLRNMIVEARTGRIDAPMAPILAGKILGHADWVPTIFDGSLHCEALRWMLSVPGLPPAIGADAVRRMRFGLLPLTWGMDLASDKDDSGSKPTAEAGEYPYDALLMRIEGTVRVRVWLGEEARLGPFVIGRSLKVPGIPGSRPLAFEDALDEASRERARRTPPRANLAPGSPYYDLELVWRIE
jgi:hypothetical protein